MQAVTTAHCGEGVGERKSEYHPRTKAHTTYTAACRPLLKRAVGLVSGKVNIIQEHKLTPHTPPHAGRYYSALWVCSHHIHGRMQTVTKAHCGCGEWRSEYHPRTKAHTTYTAAYRPLLQRTVGVVSGEVNIIQEQKLTPHTRLHADRYYSALGCVGWRRYHPRTKAHTTYTAACRPLLQRTVGVVSGKVNIIQEQKLTPHTVHAGRYYTLVSGEVIYPEQKLIPHTRPHAGRYYSALTVITAHCGLVSGEVNIIQEQKLTPHTRPHAGRYYSALWSGERRSEYHPRTKAHTTYTAACRPLLQRTGERKSEYHPRTKAHTTYTAACRPLLKRTVGVVSGEVNIIQEQKLTPHTRPHADRYYSALWVW
ncbi:hypothetical protein J6590_085877 [Homalodisca vitripennis]|nr:hypothetical protein J6590_085877 [Homalodisca vitripennis]